MYEIVDKKILAEKEVWLEVNAPVVAKKHRAGQFVIVIPHERGERIPLTVADKDPKRGTIVLVVQEIGKSTAYINRMKVGESFYSLVGPLGKPTHIKKYGNCVVVGGGVGIAPLYPITKALYEAGNRVTSILGARTKELLIMEDMMRSVSHETIVVTDDGSYGQKGLVTDALKPLLESNQKIDLVVTIGPAIMMKFVCLLTKEYNVPTLASLNSIMVDGTGMCGACRIEVGGETKFVCVDGPEFDGHKVDFDLLMKRQRAYIKQERLAYETFLKEHKKCYE